MKIFIIILIAILSISMYTPQDIYAYNIHQKVEAEREYDNLAKMIDNIETAIKDLDFVEEVEEVEEGVSFSSTLCITDYSLVLSTKGVTVSTDTDSIFIIKKEVDICREVTDLIRDELKVLLQKHLEKLKVKRDAINVE